MKPCLAAVLEAAETSGAPQPLDHEGEQSWDNAARELSRAISAEKQGPPPHLQDGVII